MKKRLLSAFMALALCLTLLPAPAWAEEADAPEGGAPAADEQPAVQSEPAPQAAEAAVQAAEAAVAEVGGVNYNNIQEAFEKVKQSNGGTLTLLTPAGDNPWEIWQYADTAQGTLYWFTVFQGKVTVLTEKQLTAETFDGQ